MSSDEGIASGDRMNLLGLALILGSAAHVVYLCVKAFRLTKLLSSAKNANELLVAVVKARRHYGLHAAAAFVAAAVLACAKGALVLTGAYQNPPVFMRLAVGDATGSGIVALGLVVCVLLATSVVEVIFVIRYDAYLRMMYALRKFVNLDLRLSP